MTVSNTTANRTQVTGNGVWDDITINWPMFQNSGGTHAIEVIRTTIATGATSTLAETTDYTVALDGTSPNTGVITLVAGAPSSAYRFTVIPNIQKKQEVDLQNAVQVDMPTIEAALDKLTLITQAQDELLSRAVVLSEDTQITNITLPSFSVADANKVVTINDDGTGMTTMAVDELVSVSSFDINSLTTETTVSGSADYVAMYDASATAQRKVLIDNLPTNISGKTELTSGQIDTTNDMLIVYDADAGVNKKVSVDNLGASDSNTAAVKDIQITNVTAASSLTISAALTWYDVTGMTVSITPDNKRDSVYIGGIFNFDRGASGQTLGFRVVRSDGKIIWSGGNDGSNHNTMSVTQGAGTFAATANAATYVMIHAIDQEVNTTASVTYKLQVISRTANNIQINRNTTDTDTTVYARAASQIFAMNIGKENQVDFSKNHVMFRFNKDNSYQQVSNTIFDSTNQLATGLPNIEPLSLPAVSTNTKVIAFAQTSIRNASENPLFKFYLKANGTSSNVGDAASSRSRVTTSHRHQLSASSGHQHSIPVIDTINPANAGLTLDLIMAGDTTYSGSNANIFNVTATTSTDLIKGQTYISAFLLNPDATSSTIKQIVTSTKTDTGSGAVGGATFYDPTLSVSITPTSASSYLWITGRICATADVSTYEGFWVKLQRDASNILVGDAASNRIPVTFNQAGGDEYIQTIPFNFIIPASSTSATTIKALIGAGESVTGYINRTVTDTDSYVFPRAASQITIVEILPS